MSSSSSYVAELRFHVLAIREPGVECTGSRRSKLVEPQTRSLVQKGWVLSLQFLLGSIDCLWALRDPSFGLAETHGDLVVSQRMLRLQQLQRISSCNQANRLSRSSSSPLSHHFFGREGSPTKIDYGKKGTLILTSLLEDLAI